MRIMLFWSLYWVLLFWETSICLTITFPQGRPVEGLLVSNLHFAFSKMLWCQAFDGAAEQEMF